MSTSRMRLTLTAAVASVLALTACSGESGGADGSTSAGTGAIGGDIMFYDTSGGEVWTELSATLFANFTKKTGVTVSDDYNEASTKFIAAAEAKQVPWSLVFLPTVGDAAAAAEKGYLAELDTSVVPVDKLESGSYDKYGVQVGTFGMVLAWDEKAYPADAQPSSVADLFDVAKFPGKRCFFNNPQYGWTLEAALLADGVTADKLYPLDVERALKKLDGIKNDITWWSSGADSIANFENGSCDIGILWANRALVAKRAGFPMAISWKDGGYSNSVWAVPAGAPNAAAAQQLIADVINDEAGQIAFASKIPTPIPAAVKGADPSAYPQDIQPYLPLGDNVRSAVKQDGVYYQKNLTQIVDRFNRWVGK
ncbi:putative spermidine/putrescine transport system substrate-binding protein [Streptosporangium becharense]|uniref:Putative spermidine/putrescine transport system substrate-binding protein n=1 Tax=Streptosporangium becharense TaxID=1816182 RepID=A0A7W9IDD7_9ACTN|nr:extracellular solute-binding protein [Streptosporangium becharense]MBB2915029.1 putative spermidine/putrescine transport system substrate-binding protein [Streptosporangium becharense]MBB5818078.1 putative spermidine/putrescine transport system substrate-binding protein [Streptosporangium becharense]